MTAKKAEKTFMFFPLFFNAAYFIIFAMAMIFVISLLNFLGQHLPCHRSNLQLIHSKFLELWTSSRQM